MNDFTFLIPISETLQTAWEKVKGSKAIFWSGYAYVIVIVALLKLIEKVTPGHTDLVLGLTNFFGNFFVSLLELGLIYVGIRRAFDLPINYSQIFRAFDRHLIIKIILLFLLQLLILFIVVMLFMMPVLFYETIRTQPSRPIIILLYLIPLFALIYTWVRLSLSPGLVIDKELNPGNAIKKSFEATRSNFWRIFIISLLLTILMIVSAIPLGIGLIWTIPFSFIVYGVIYKKLLVNIKNL